ncbi:MAG: caleosin family protein [Myxococcota bacterium]
MRDLSTNQNVIVSGGKVYADKNGDGKIQKSEEINTPRKAALVEAADYISTYFEPRALGPMSQDRSIESKGSLNQVELKEFEGAGTDVNRNKLLEHLAYFDSNGDGKISLRENFGSWKSLRYGLLKSVTLTAGSAVFFGLMAGTGLTIHLDKLPRPKGSTGIYGKDGNLNPEKFEFFMKAFEAKADETGVMTQDQAKAVIAKQIDLGMVPKRQFGSFYDLCEKMNNGKTVTVDQVRWLYDGSLMWRAASMTGHDGHNTL